MISSVDWQIVHLSDIAPTPWRNGGGTTRELIAWPNAEQWLWRASVAEVEQSGPFSSFPSVQRWFAVLSGDGVGLTVDGQLHNLRQDDSPLYFDGGSQTRCELLGGATKDFNFMLQGGSSGRMHRIRGEYEVVMKTPKIVALYAVNTPATIRFCIKVLELVPHSLAWMFVNEDAALHVQAADALLMEIDL